jgi:hypothetical protein
VRLVLIVLVLALAIGFLIGGRFAGLSSLRIRLAPLAIVGLALQYLSPSRGDLPYLLLMASFAMLTIFAAVNLRTPGFPLILIGMLMNFLVIGANHGMPVTRHALVASGQQDTLSELVRLGGEKHHLAGPDDRLLFLADVTPIPPPVHQAVSAGDVVAYGGGALVLVAAMRRRRNDSIEGDAIGGEAPAATEGASGG